jgi:hypothetical protein
MKDPYSTLQKYMELGTYALIYETEKEYHIIKFNIIELMISVFNSFYNMITNTELIII